MNILFVSILQNFDFAHYIGPIVKFASATNTSLSGGGGGADDKFITLFVKKVYGLVSAFSQPYHTPAPASCDMAGFSQIPAESIIYKDDNW